MQDFDAEAFQRAWQRSGLSVAELAHRAGVPRVHQVRAWLHGKRRPTVRYLRALAEALGIPPHELTSSDPATATLRDLRVWVGYTQRELADTAGLSASRYALLEQGQHAPSDDEGPIGEALAQALDVDVATIRAALLRSRCVHGTEALPGQAATEPAVSPRPRRQTAPAPQARCAAAQVDLQRYGTLLSIKEAADILGVHVNTAHRYARDGLIPAHRLPSGRRFYILRDELLDSLRAHPETAEEGDDN